MLITCAACQKQYDAEPNLKSRPAPTVAKDATQIYLACPHCLGETHSHYVTPAILRRQKLVSVTLANYRQRQSDPKRFDAAWRRYKQAQADLERAFDKVNQKAAV